MKSIIKKIPFIKSFIRSIDNQYEREKFVFESLQNISENSIILDAGCGSQRYRKFCDHLIYKSQDFGQYTKDIKEGFTTGHNKYEYGQLDYISDIWSINEEDCFFDAIICTEVFEHIPFPNETVKEFNRLLKPGGVLILTAPSNSLRHFDPYYFYSGFSDRWYEKILADNNFKIESIEAVGDYFSFIKVEIFRTMFKSNIIAKLILFPAFVYYSLKAKTTQSINTLCMGYHVIAHKN